MVSVLLSASVERCFVSRMRDFLGGNLILLIHLHFNPVVFYTPMKMAHLSQTPPNMSSIGAVCDSLGKTSLTSLVGNYWATDGLRVNSSPVKGEFIIFPLFLLEENAILPMTARADCEQEEPNSLEIYLF